MTSVWASGEPPTGRSRAGEALETAVILARRAPCHLPQGPTAESPTGTPQRQP